MIDFLIPHEYEEEHRSEDERNHQKLVRTGLLVSLGMAIHIFPEGVVTLFGTIKDPDLGFMQHSQVKSGKKTMRERTEKDVT